MLGKLYDHKPEHYRFPRTIEGYHPEHEPDAKAIDKVIAVISVVGLVALVAWSIVERAA